MAAAIIGLFIWIFLTESSVVGDSLLVSVPAVILAGATAVVSLVSYIWTPKNLILPFALTAYLLLAATIAALIIGTGGLSSPFIALWMLVVVFAGVFGLWGLIPILAAIGTFAGFEYVANNLSTDSIVIIGFSGILPLIASFIVWHSKVGGPKEDSNPDSKAYRNLANELTEVASKSEVVINAIGDGVMAIDSQGIIQLINPAAQRIIGWGKQDALALNYKSVLQLFNGKNEPLDAAGDPIQQVLNTNQQIRTNDLTLITKSTKKLMISLVVSPVGDAGSGVIVVFRDITKEKAEEREQAEFISTASHEMRTPVASIEGYLGLAMNPTTATVDQRAHDYIMKAHESAQHLGRLFQDLLDVSKATDGRLSNIPKVVDVTKFVFDVVQGLQQKATDKGLRLSYVPMPEGGSKTIAPVYNVNLDNDHIREIVNNLVENAIKYTPKGEVIVDVTGDDAHVTISIKDSGIGIPAEDMPHLFQKFYRVDNKDTREIGGTGLGLYLVRRLAETLGGRVWAESVYGSGSTFFVELPRVSSSEATQIVEQAGMQAAVAPPVAPTDDSGAIPVVPEPAAAETPDNAPVKPAQSVPRGESLSREQIEAYVAKQKALIAEQQSAGQPAPVPTEQPAEPAPANPPQPTATERPNAISVPTRNNEGGQ